MLALGINGVGLEDDSCNLHDPTPETFHASFKPFSFYNTFIDELVDGGDGWSV